MKKRTRHGPSHDYVAGVLLGTILTCKQFGKPLFPGDLRQIEKSARKLYAQQAAGISITAALEEHFVVVDAPPRRFLPRGQRMPKALYVPESAWGRLLTLGICTSRSTVKDANPLHTGAYHRYVAPNRKDTEGT